MRAFLIDPEPKTITEIDFNGGCKAIQQIIGCRSFTTGSRPLNGSFEKGYDTIYCSDDVLEEGDNPLHWFQVDADRDPPSSFPLSGKGLVVGTDTEGGDADAVISHEELTARISFTRRKFRGFETTERPGGIQVLMKAPIIGEDDKKAPSMPSPDRRPASWDTKMVLSGEPLIEDRHFEQLLANALTFAETTVPVLKIFLPHIRFYLVGLGADFDSVFAVVDQGPKGISSGVMSLTDIVNARLGEYVRPERDKYITLDQPWAHYLSERNA